MKWIRTIRARFALWTTSIILVFLVAYGGIVYFNLRHSLYAAVDNALVFSTDQLNATLNVENGQIMPLETITPDESGIETFAEHGLTLVVLAKDGSVLQAVGPFSSFHALLDKTELHASFRTIYQPGWQDSVRIYTLPVLDNNQVAGWIQAMQSLGEVEESLQQQMAVLLVGGGALTLLAGFAGYFIATRALTPIDNITRAARCISTEDLTARLSLPDTGDEVSRLAATFNEMLDRLEIGFKRERRFTADASHELRTPLAAMQAILSVMREKQRAPHEYQQALADLSDETNRMQGLVEDLLNLARGENPLLFNMAPLDLSLLLSDVIDSLRPLADSKDLALTCDLPATMPFTGDMDALIRLFVNLLENAIKYTESGSIFISANQVDKTIAVEVNDTGIGIPPEHLPHIFERFYRVETARSSSGVGLGLAIASQIVHAHGGRITVESTPGAGTTFVVRFPVVR